MTRTALRHTLSVLAAVALVSVLVNSSPAQAVSQTTQLMSNIYKADSDAKLGKPKPKTPKGLATKKVPPSRADFNTDSSSLGQINSSD
jgi:hypothetical protein